MGEFVATEAVGEFVGDVVVPMPVEAIVGDMVGSDVIVGEVVVTDAIVGEVVGSDVIVGEVVGTDVIVGELVGAKVAEEVDGSSG